MIELVLEEIKKKVSCSKTYEIMKVESVKNANIAFIDGGQQEILKAVNFSLQKIRVAAIFFKGDIRTNILLKEFLLLITSENINGKLAYKAKSFGDLEIEQIFDSSDESLKSGSDSFEISSIGGIIRRISELKLALDVDSEIVVLDGTLRCKYLQEKEIMMKLRKKKICSLAKTSRNVDEYGECILSSLAKINSPYCWKYPLYKTDYNAYAVKLHSSSKYVFEFNAFEENSDEMVGALCSNSRDVVFPGYPYGLIIADRIARVSEEEKERLLMQIQAKAGNSWPLIKNSLNVLNGHDVLDNIS